MTPVCHRLVDQMGNEDNLSAPEVVPSPEQNPGKQEQIVQDEVSGYVGSRCDENIVLGEEVVDITDLRKQKQNPMNIVSNLESLTPQEAQRGLQNMHARLGPNSPVDSSHGGVLTEGSIVLICLLPDLLALLGIVWRVEGVVASDDHD